MSLNQEIGQKGEDIAAAFLEDKGYILLERNHRHRRSEIDIIAKDGDILVFVEVKSRSSDFYGKPESFVTARKEELMASASSAYMEKINHDWEIRFDFISILFHGELYEIEHFKDAFFPRF